MNGLAQALCFFCSAIGNAPEPHIAQGAGDIWYTHEMLGRDTHLLRLSTTDVVIDTHALRDRRLYAFAYQFAERNCQGRFDLALAERSSWLDTRPLYARQYAFRCR